MKTNFYRLTALTLGLSIILGISGCAGGGNATGGKDGIPGWAKSGKHPVYPDGMYWTGVGSGPDLKTASDQARTEVASQLRVQIKNSTKTMEEEYTGDDREFYANAFNSTTETIVDETIQGIQVVESKPAGGTYYAYAVLDRNQYLSALADELRQYGDRLSGLHDDAQSLLDQGKIFPAIENFSDALALVPEVYPRQSFYNAIADMRYHLPDNLTGPAMLSELRTILSGVTMTVLSGTDQTAAPGQRLPDVIAVKISLARNGRSIPISGMPMRAVYESGDLAAKPVTDDRGVAELSVSAVPGNRTDAGAVIITPNLGRLPEIMAPQLKHLTATISYRVSGDVPAFAIIVRDRDGNRLKSVEDDLAQAVIQAGFKVDPAADMLIEGKATLDDVREISLGGRPTYQAEATLDITVTDLSSGVQTASTSVSKKTVNSNKSKASRNAINDLGGAIKRRAMTELLGDALGE
ncbi:MAG: LPP20 family lipoprotein [Candidatus Marinimicrobia bacterium]|nr:LPP20 family lipoprotein [Candidatus Neomarinimicrobiota bacterium]